MRDEFHRGTVKSAALWAAEQARTRHRTTLPDQGKRPQPRADHAAGYALEEDAARQEAASTATQLPATLYGRRRGSAGRGRCRARGLVGSGPAVRHILQREFEIYHQPEYERLAGISVSHIYNLRASESYRRRRVRVHHTRATQVSIAERRQPDPQGRPGYLRVDTVHQGQRDGQLGLYHLNAVDTVTQWQVVGCVETISERHLVPVLEAMLHQFPFRILGFHCDNGSEFLNHQVARLLNKLLAEFTKSRAYRTTDNALVEGKNGAVVRKHIGYGPIGAEHAEAFQKFYTAHFNPYLNYHRPCGFATLEYGARGKKKRVYHAEDYQTPYEKLSSLADWQQYLKEGISAQMLQRQASRMSDTEAARRMQKAKLSLLAQCRGKR
jgi:hypothetical protein